MHICMYTPPSTYDIIHSLEDTNANRTESAMYIEPIAYHFIFTLACFAPLTLITSGIVLLRSRRVGGLTFCQLGPIGFSFYIRRR